MQIDEVGKLLAVSEDTIRFYEVEDLIPIRWKENYSDTDITKIKKVLIFRKLGIPVEEIAWIKEGTWKLEKSLKDNIERLERSAEEMDGALEFSYKIKAEQLDYATMDAGLYWELICTEEVAGKKFFDVQKDGVKESDELMIDTLKKLWGFELKEVWKKDGARWGLFFVAIVLVVD